MWRDLRYAGRTLAKSPGFATIAILTLALGIGLASTIFSAVNALLIRPLPLMRDQQQLVVIEHHLKKLKETEDVGFDYPGLLDARKHLTTIEGISAWQDTTMIITGTGKPDRYLGAAIQADAFQMFGVVPTIGRWFRIEENEPSAEPVVILGHDLWQQRYAANPGVVGKTVEVNGMMATIIGVMPKGWRFPEDADLWMPLRFDEKKEKRGEFFLNPIGRLKPGVTLAQANAELANFAESKRESIPIFTSGSTFRAVPMRESRLRVTPGRSLSCSWARCFSFI